MRGQAVVTAAGNHSDHNTSKRKVAVGLVKRVGQASANLPKTEGHVEPSYLMEVRQVAMNSCVQSAISSSMLESEPEQAARPRL